MVMNGGLADRVVEDGGEPFLTQPTVRAIDEDGLVCTDLNGGEVVALVAGFVSVAGYVFVQPFLERTLGLHDTCGVHNLHGMPGLIGGIGGAISAARRTSSVAFSPSCSRTGAGGGGFGAGAGGEP